MSKQINQIKGAAGGTHTYSQAEKRSYCDHINQELADDEHLQDVLPMDPLSDDLFSAQSQGILFW